MICPTRSSELRLWWHKRAHNSLFACVKAIVDWLMRLANVIKLGHTLRACCSFNISTRPVINSNGYLAIHDHVNYSYRTSLFLHHHHHVGWCFISSTIKSSWYSTVDRWALQTKLLEHKLISQQTNLQLCTPFTICACEEVSEFVIQSEISLQAIRHTNSHQCPLMFAVCNLFAHSCDSCNWLYNTSIIGYFT